MGTTLTGTEIKDTYDSLIKVTDSGPLSGTLKALSDGLGNDSSLSLSTTAASITGSLSLSSGLIFSAADFVIGANTSDGADNKASYLCGGATQSTARGANIRVYGNEYTDQQGDLVMYSGNVANSEIQLRAQSSSSQILMYTNDTERMRIDSTGNVGIGTSAPAYKLEVFDAGGSSLAVGASTGKGFLYADNGGATLGALSAIPLRFSVNGSEHMRIDSAGNVGIGTSTPTSKLHVQGTSYFFDQSIFSDKVGIGTSSPIGKLHVEGVGSGQGIRLNHSASNSFIYSTIANSDDIAFDNLLGNLAIYTGGAERLRVLSTGGLTFNGDTAAANALDDYEEGTWTPIVNDLTNEATMISGTTGFYTKIGRQVTLSGYVRTTSIGSVSGDVYIGGMPFTSNGSLGSETSVTFGYFTAMNLGAAGVSVGAYIVPATTRMALYINDVATGITAMQGSEWGNTGYVHLGITYFV